MSGVVLAVRVEHSTNALVMSTPVSATWVAVALFERLAVPLVTLLTIAASLGPGTSQPAAIITARATDLANLAPFVRRLSCVIPISVANSGQGVCHTGRRLYRPRAMHGKIPESQASRP